MARYRTRTVIDPVTGERVQVTVLYTPAEESARDAEEAQAAAEQAAYDEGEEVVNQIARDPRLKSIAEVLWQIAKAANTGNWSAFELDDGTPVGNKAQFNQYLKETFQKL